jgi:hypothetical protein
VVSTKGCQHVVGQNLPTLLEDPAGLICSKLLPDCAAVFLHNSVSTPQFALGRLLLLFAHFCHQTWTKVVPKQQIPNKYQQLAESMVTHP